MSKADKLQTIANNLATESETVKQQTELLQQIRTSLVGKTVPCDSGDSGSYDEGYADGQQNVLDIVNYELAGRDLETAETADDVSSALDNAFIEVSDVAYGYGKQAEYDAFWDAYLQKGSIREISMLFAGNGWNDATFQPKYSIHAENPYMLFRKSSITDIGQTLKERNVVMTLKGPILQYTFSGMASKTLDNVVFAEPITTMYTAFGSATNLESIECPIPVQDASISRDNFYWCYALKEIRFNGTIASDLSFSYSANLSTDSIDSIIGALKDRTGTTAFTLTFHKDVGAKLTQAQKDAISAKNWTLVY